MPGPGCAESTSSSYANEHWDLPETLSYPNPNPVHMQRPTCRSWRPRARRMWARSSMSCASRARTWPSCARAWTGSRRSAAVARPALTPAPPQLEAAGAAMRQAAMQPEAPHGMGVRVRSRCPAGLSWRMRPQAAEGTASPCPHGGCAQACSSVCRECRSSNAWCIASWLAAVFNQQVVRGAVGWLVHRSGMRSSAQAGKWCGGTCTAIK